MQPKKNFQKKVRSYCNLYPTKGIKEANTIIMSLSLEPGAVLALMTVVGGVSIYTALKGRHIERMKQIELGQALPIGPRNYSGIKLGLLSMGIGTGILISFMLNRAVFPDTPELYPGFIFLCGGLGLFLSYFMISNLKKASQP